MKRPQPKIIETRNCKHYNPALFREELEHIPWEIIKDDDFEWLSCSHNLRRDPFDTSQWLIGLPCLNKVDLT